MIGRAFIERFNGYQFTALTRSASKARQRLPDSVQLIESLDCLDALDEFDAVINLAGEPIIDKRWSRKQKEIISQSRWKITKQLVDLFSRSELPPKVFLSGSAIGAYGNSADELVDESYQITGNDFSSSLCRRWEEIAIQAAPFTRVVFLRTGIVLARQEGALSKMLLPFKCGLGGRVGSGEQFMSWIHVEDHISAIDSLLANERFSGPVNLVAPDAVSNRDFTQELAQSLNRPAFLPLPEKVLQLLLGESSCLLLEGQRVIPQKLLSDGFRFSFPTLKSALSDLLGKNEESK